MPRAYMFGCVKILVRSALKKEGRGRGGGEGHILSLALLLILATVQKPQNGNPFHHACGRVTQELTARLQGPIYPNVVLRGHEEITRLGWVVRGLFGDVIPPRAIGKIPVAGEGLSEDWI